MGRIGPVGIWELLIILVVVLLIFGPRRLPEMAKGIGQSVREFRKGVREMRDDFESDGGTTSASTKSNAEAAPKEPQATEAQATEAPAEGKSA